MENNYIVINNIKYIPIEAKSSRCNECALDFGDGSCFMLCSIFENILNKRIIFKSKIDNK